MPVPRPVTFATFSPVMAAVMVVTNRSKNRALMPWGTVVVGTPAAGVRLLLAHAAGVHLDLCERFAVEPGSISAIDKSVADSLALRN